MKQKRLGLYIVCALALIVCAFAEMCNYRNAPSDFEQDYIAAHKIRNHTGLYNSTLKFVCGQVPSRRCLNSDHPPFYSIICLPLTFLSYSKAFCFIGVISILSLIISIELIGRYLDLKLQWRLLVLSAMLLSESTRSVIATGNLSFLIALLIVSSWFTLEKRKLAISGIFLAIAVMLKIYPVILCCPMLLPSNRKWKVSFIISGLTIFFGSLYFVDIWSFYQYTTIIAPQNAAQYMSHGFNLSLGGLFFRLLGSPNLFSPWLGRLANNESLAWMLTLISCALLLFSSLIFLRRDLRSGADAPIFFSDIIPTMLLISPLTWSHSLLPATITLASLIKRNYVSNRAGIMVALVIFLFPEKSINQWLIYSLNVYPLPWFTNLVSLAPLWGLLLLHFFVIRGHFRK